MGTLILLLAVYRAIERVVASTAVLHLQIDLEFLRI